MFELRSPLLPEPLAIRPGEAVRIAGPNGAGKTTLLRALAGLATHLQASATWHGQDPRRLTADAVVQTVSFVPEVARDAFVGLTVQGEARMRGESLADGREIGTLSTGEARQVALSFVRGALWLLDEPARGLDEAAIRRLRQQIRARGDAAVVFVDHAGTLADLADRTVDLAPTGPDPAWPEASDGPVVATTTAQERHGLWLPALEVHQGIQVVTGPNGCGKTTLLRAAAGLGGAPLTLGGRPAAIGSDVRMLIADARAHMVGDTVAGEIEACDAAVADAFVPLDLRGRHPLTLSRGEAQRVALAKVLGLPAAVYLLDEPEAHLDAAGLQALADVLGLRATSAILIATHDARLANAYPVRWEGA